MASLGHNKLIKIQTFIQENDFESDVHIMAAILLQYSMC